MTTDCHLTFWPRENIVAVYLRVERDDEGLRLHFRHVHEGGTVLDCEPDRYDRLTLGEAHDLLEVNLAELVKRGVRGECF